MCLLTYLCITCANTVNLATITLYYGVCVRLLYFRSSCSFIDFCVLSDPRIRPSW